MKKLVVLAVLILTSVSMFSQITGQARCTEIVPYGRLQIGRYRWVYNHRGGNA